MKSQPSEPSEPDKEREILLKQFRAYLHLAITAKQTDQDKEFKAMPGPQIQDYCRVLAELPDNTLAGELWHPVRAILEQIDKAALYCRRRLIHKQVKDADDEAKLERILWQLDYALALIMRLLPIYVRLRAENTKCDELLGARISEMAIGDGVDAAKLIRRHKKLRPDQYCKPEVIFHSESNNLYRFAWETYERIEVLNQLADEFPEHIRAAARRMHGWPMLVHRHTSNRRQFSKLASRLELGAEYPIDVSEGARFQPDTPLVQYLDPLIRRMHIMCEELGDLQFKSVETERSLLLHVWWWWPDEKPGEEELAALRAARQLPPLNKATAIEWAEKALVPLILATDARDWKNCKEPVLQRIAKQKGVKSRATFKSRLLAAVTATLRRLARPA